MRIIEVHAYKGDEVVEIFNIEVTPEYTVNEYLDLVEEYQSKGLELNIMNFKEVY